MVRHNFVSGTHALTVALFGVLRPGDTMVSVTGIPYDTLRGVSGITGDGNGSLKEFGIQYEQIDLKDDGTPDYEAMERELKPGIKMVYIQRSRGSVCAPLCLWKISSGLRKLPRGKHQAVLLWWTIAMENLCRKQSQPPTAQI